MSYQFLNSKQTLDRLSCEQWIVRIFLRRRIFNTNKIDVIWLIYAYSEPVNTTQMKITISFQTSASQSAEIQPLLLQYKNFSNMRTTKETIRKKFNYNKIKIFYRSSKWIYNYGLVKLKNDYFCEGYSLIFSVNVLMEHRYLKHTDMFQCFILYINFCLARKNMVFLSVELILWIEWTFSERNMEDMENWQSVDWKKFSFDFFIISFHGICYWKSILIWNHLYWI